MNKLVMLLIMMLGSGALQAEVIKISFSGSYEMEQGNLLFRPTEEQLMEVFDIQFENGVASGEIYYDVSKTPPSYTFTNGFGWDVTANEPVVNGVNTMVSYAPKEANGFYLEETDTEMVSGAISLPHLMTNDLLSLRDYSASGGNDVIVIRDSAVPTNHMGTYDFNYASFNILYAQLTVTGPSGENLFEGIELDSSFVVDQTILDQSTTTVHVEYRQQSRPLDFYAPRTKQISTALDIDVDTITIEYLSNEEPPAPQMCVY